MNISTLYGPTPWTDPDQYIKDAFPPSETLDLQFGLDNPVFEGFFAVENFTAERRKAREDKFGAWTIDGVVDPYNTVPEETYLEHFGETIKYTGEKFKLGAAEWLPDDTINKLVKDLRESCIVQDGDAKGQNIGAFITTTREALILKDERIEFVEVIGLGSLQCLPDMFAQRYWVFPLGNFQHASLTTKFGFSFTMVFVRRTPAGNEEIEERLVEIVAGPPGRLWANFKEKYFLPLVPGLDPDVDNIWWSKELNPPLEKMFPIKGRALFSTMLRRIQAMAYGKPVVGIIRIYFGPFLDGEAPVEVVKLNRYAQRGNNHWWVVIVDSFTGISYEHNSSGRNTESEVLINNLNIIISNLSPDNIVLLNDLRAASAQSTKTNILDWELIPENFAKGAKGYMIKELEPGPIRVKTMQQTNGSDCGLFCIKNLSMFINNLHLDVQGSEEGDLIPEGWKSGEYRRVIHENLKPDPFPEHVSLNFLDPIGQQLSDHPQFLERAYWHLENAGAILISFKASDYRFLHHPKAGQKVYELPECKPRPPPRGGCICGYTIVPVPLDHKVILQSTMEIDKKTGTFTETDNGKVSLKDAETARDKLKDDGIVVGDGAAKYRAAYNRLLQAALKRQTLTLPLPRLLVGKCKSGAFVVSNGGHGLINDEYEIKACGYNMRQAGADCLGPLRVGILYPMRVNERLWAWISTEVDEPPVVAPAAGPAAPVKAPAPGPAAPVNAPVPGPAAPIKAPAPGPKAPVKAPAPGPKAPVKAPAAGPVAPEKIAFSKRPFVEKTKITGKRIRQEAKARSVKRREKKITDHNYDTSSDSDDSIDGGISCAHGIKPRKRRRIQAAHVNKRRLYEFSDSELDEDGEFDPTGKARVAKRVKLSQSEENLDVYMRGGYVPHFVPTALVTPDSALLGLYTRKDPLPKPPPAEKVLQAGPIEGLEAPDVDLIISVEDIVGGGEPIIIDELLPREILKSGFAGVVEYLRNTPLIYTNGGEDEPATYTFDEGDELSCDCPPELSEIVTTEEGFQKFCDVINEHIKTGDLSPNTGIQISKWATMCLGPLDFTFTHNETNIITPPEMYIKGVEKGIRAYISSIIGSEVEFTLQYRYGEGVGVLYESFEDFRLPFFSNKIIIDPAKRETVNAIITPGPMNKVGIRSIMKHGEVTIDESDLPVFETYLSQFHDLRSFAQSCFKRFPQLIAKRPKISHNISVVVGVFEWKLFGGTEDWRAYLGGLDPGATVHISFTRQFFVKESSLYYEALGGPVEFLLGRWYEGPLGEQTYVPRNRRWVYASHILDDKFKEIETMIDEDCGNGTPFGYMIGDAKLKVPPQKEWFWKNTLDTIIEELRKALTDAKEADVAHVQTLRVLIMGKGDIETEAAEAKVPGAKAAEAKAAEAKAAGAKAAEAKAAEAKAAEAKAAEAKAAEAKAAEAKAAEAKAAEAKAAEAKAAEAKAAEAKSAEAKAAEAKAAEAKVAEAKAAEAKAAEAKAAEAKVPGGAKAVRLEAAKAKAAIMIEAARAKAAEAKAAGAKAKAAGGKVAEAKAAEAKAVEAKVAEAKAAEAKAAEAKVAEAKAAEAKAAEAKAAEAKVAEAKAAEAKAAEAKVAEAKAAGAKVPVEGVEEGDGDDDFLYDDDEDLVMEVMAELEAEKKEAEEPDISPGAKAALAEFLEEMMEDIKKKAA